MVKQFLALICGMRMHWKQFCTCIFWWKLYNSTTKSWEIRRLIDFLQEKPFVSCQIFPKKHTQSFSCHFSVRRCAAFSGDFPTTKSWFERLEVEGRNLPSLKLTGNIALENGWSWNIYEYKIFLLGAYDGLFFRGWAVGNDKESSPRGNILFLYCFYIRMHSNSTAMNEPSIICAHTFRL